MATLPITAKTVQLKLVYLLLGAGVLFGVGGAIGGVVAAVTTWAVMRRPATAVAVSQPTPKPRQKYTREELKTLAVGKTEKQVIELLGQPKTRVVTGNDAKPRSTPLYSEPGGTHDDVAAAVANMRGVMLRYEGICYDKEGDKESVPFAANVYIQGDKAYNAIFHELR